MLQREVPPRNPTIPQLVSWIERQLEYIGSYSVRVDQALEFLEDVVKDGGINAPWFWNDAGVVADPGEQYMGCDEVQLTDATVLVLSETNLLNNGPTTWIGRIQDGDQVGVLDDSKGVRILFNVIAATTYHATATPWWEVPVLNVGGSVVNPAADDLMRFLWAPGADFRLALSVP